MKNGIDTGTLTCASKSGVKIIDNVRIEVPLGRAYALLGQDARAKRLVMRFAAANLKNVTLADDESKLCGLPLPPRAAYVFDLDRLFSFMTCREYLRYSFGGLKMGKEKLEERIDGLLGAACLNRRADRKISALSDAEYLCLCVAFSMAQDPSNVLINADTLSCCKENRELVNKLIFGLKMENKAVLINISDPRLCGNSIDTVGIMDGGSIVLEGDPSKLAAGDPKAYSIKGEGSVGELRDKFNEISQKYGVRIRGIKKPTLNSVYKKIVEK